MACRGGSSGILWCRGSRSSASVAFSHELLISFITLVDTGFEYLQLLEVGVDFLLCSRKGRTILRLSGICIGGQISYDELCVAI